MELHAELRALFAKAEFLASAGSTQDFPPEGPSEIAFLGRSNVGKSSAINAITGRKRLAFAAKAPGRTQTINFYAIDSMARLVDLPGYGYARVPQSVRAQWEFLVSGYLGRRASLAGAVVLMDVRHPWMAQDERLFGWLRPLAVPTIVLLTKADKLSRSAATAAREKVLQRLSARPSDVLLFSSTTGLGTEIARERLAQWLPPEASGSRK